jgi:hypothetical protein
MRYVFHTVVMYTFRGTVYKQALTVYCMWDFWVPDGTKTLFKLPPTVLCIVQRRTRDGQHYVCRHTVHSTPRAVIQTLPYIEGRKVEVYTVSGQGQRTNSCQRRKFSQYKNFIPTSAYYNTVHALWCHDAYRYYSTLLCIANCKLLSVVPCTLSDLLTQPKCNYKGCLYSLRTANKQNKE